MNWAEGWITLWIWNTFMFITIGAPTITFFAWLVKKTYR